jgi:hypothetical protein
VSNAAVSSGEGSAKEEYDIYFRTHLEFGQTVVDFHVTILDGSRQIALLDEKLERAFRAPLFQAGYNAMECAGSLLSEPTGELGV